MNEDDDMLAAEFALGLLEGAERDAVRNRLDKEPALAERVEWWRGQLEPLAAHHAAEPSEALWTRIEAALPGNDNAAELRARRWRSVALAASVVAALLGLTLALRPGPVPPQVVATGGPVAPAPVLLASVAGDDGVVATIAYDGTAGQLTIVPAKFEGGPLADRKGDPELWIIPIGGNPRSLGTFSPQHATRAAARADARALIARGATFAISMEPRGGSPSGKPTGPILGTGTLNGT